jgi:hypothetical protein
VLEWAQPIPYMFVELELNVGTIFVESKVSEGRVGMIFLLLMKYHHRAD